VFDLSVTTRSESPGVGIATLTLTSTTPAEPPTLTLKWSLPSVDVVGQWTTRAYFNKTIDADWGPTRVRSMLASNAPVLALFGTDDTNRLTFATSDALSTTDLTTGVREENGMVVNTIRLFGERHPATQRISVDIRFDTREVPYFESLKGVSDWWAAMPEYIPASVPEPALSPMYSTWYSYHQSVSTEALLKEIAVGTTFGLKSIIIDDGWQTTDSNRGYAFTGDWRPERIPDIGDFVRKAHEQDVNVILWYAVPLVGEKSKTYEQFKGKYLRYWNGQGAYELDPRYPDVREHIIETYRQALAEWDVDGFKLDFMGRFVARSETVLTAEDGRDFASVNEATDRLMTDLLAALRAIKPDIMLEFRQPYIGPAMRKYGNMFRAGDSPDAAVANRVRTVDLRLLSGTTAVHSDMFMWHRDESSESAARQFLNVFFAVPQISVRLEEITPDQLTMLRHYTGYWMDRRDVLMKGGFAAANPLANYPVVTAWKDGEQVIGVYADAVVRIDSARGRQQIDILNATTAASIVIAADMDDATYNYRILDVLATERERGTVTLGNGVSSFNVPPSGVLMLLKK
jgi:alpha-galactosidase